MPHSEVEGSVQLSGSISSVSEDGSTFEVRTPTGIAKVSVDSETAYTLNGKESVKHEALKVGHEVVVFREGDLATKVDAKSEIEPIIN